MAAGIPELVQDALSANLRVGPFMKTISIVLPAYQQEE
jgi:hypothetical protein